MPHFTKQLQTTEGVRTFYFNRIYTVNGLNYHISVRGTHATSHFMMHERNGSWYMSEDPMPEKWIVEVEKDLEAAIIDHLKHT